MSPRKSRKKSACFSKTTTSMPASSGGESAEAGVGWAQIDDGAGIRITHGAPEFSLAVHPRTNLIVLTDQSNNRVLLVPALN